MNRPIRVLVVEDNPLDVELVLRELRRAGFDPEWTRVETEPEFLEQLLAGVDLVISDFSLPQFSGMRALELRNQSGLDVPFILVSGTIGEDVSVEAMKHGASDYLMKDRLIRLGLAVDRALDEGVRRKEKRQAAAALLESERFNKATLDSLTAHIAIVDEHGRILAVNEAWRIFADHNGLTGDRATVGENYLEVCDQTRGPMMAEAGIVADAIRAVLAGRPAVREIEYACHGPTERRWFVARVTPFPGDGPSRAVVAHENITQRKLAEAAVISSERHYRLLFESNPEPMWVYDLETLRFLAVNAAATAHYGFTRDEFLAMTIRDIRPPETLSALEVKLQAAVAGRSGPTAWRHRRSDGTVIDVEITANDLEFAGRPARLVLARDVTERKRVAEALQRQQMELRILFDLMPALIWFKDTNNGILRVNQRVADAAGKRVEDIEGKPSSEIYPDDAARYLVDDLEIVRSGVPKLGYVEMINSAAGGRIWVQTDKVPYRDQEGKVIGIVVMAYDITERKHSEIALRESEERFRGLIENATDLIAVVDAAGCIEYQSPSAQRLLGYSPEEILGRPVTGFVHPDDVATVTEGIGRVFSNTTPKTIEYRIRHRDGRWRVFQSIGRLMPERGGKSLIVVNSRDVTETRELELQFLRAQRVEAIGTLASGIAHDLNNILAPILMAGGLLRDDIKDPRSRELLMMIETGAQRGANIIRQLLTFSRGIEGERVSVQWRHLIKEMAAIARETFPRDISIIEHVSNNLWPVSGDATQLHQVLLNLCINARDAMPAGGKLSLNARNIELTAGYLPAHPAAKPGRYVLMEVGDTGSGISPDIVEKIFDPFFTTKEIGKGTGLGLSTVLGIVKSHSGFIIVESSPRKGTAFQVYLPFDSTAELEIKPEVEAGPARGKQELILLVDDEAAIRLATAAALQQWNYRVLAAANGEAALALFQEHRAEVKLVVTDLMMPVMGGQALIQALRAIAPEIPVIAATGLDTGDKRAELRALGVNTVLMKPYSPQTLREAVFDELGEAAKPA